MGDAGLLVTLPAQSVTVRLLVGAVAAVIAARLLLRAGLRVPRVRVTAALVPAVTLVAILLLSMGDFRLPSLMTPGTGIGSTVLLPIENTYAYVAPMALPGLLGTWAIVASVRIFRRVRRTLWVSNRVASTIAAGEVPLRVRLAVRRVAARMGIDAPAVGVVSECRGGASVVGVRRPVVVLDADLVAQLDDRELEGVVAHELAHVRRRDNLMALLLSVVRDAVFFVPGGRWALRQLLVERELAADQLATEVTQRPAALAGGLLKVFDAAPGPMACAHLLPSGTLVQRVSALVDERPPAGRLRTSTEVAAVGTAVALVLTVATVLPRMVAGNDPDGGLGVLLSAPQEGDAAPDSSTVQSVDARAFSIYYDTSTLTSLEAAQGQRTTVLDDDPDLLRPSTYQACIAGSAACTSPESSPSLGMRPRPQVQVESDLQARWHAHQVANTGEVLRIYWLQSVN